MKPTLLDLFCGAGGCARGYADAGFDIVGVDICPQPRYPYTFVQADALAFLAEANLSKYAAIHASPPCPRYSTLLAIRGQEQREKHPDLIGPMRARLTTIGKPYVIENVPGAPLQKSIMLCGGMFGLRVYRHRYFESNILLFQPAHRKHLSRAAHTGKIPQADEFYSIAGHFGDKDGAQRAMGIDWMETVGSKGREIANAIPPAYTRWIGQFLINALEVEF